MHKEMMRDQKSKARVLRLFHFQPLKYRGWVVLSLAAHRVFQEVFHGPSLLVLVRAHHNWRGYQCLALASKQTVDLE